jgi:uncharacterized repeat protein (TIGR02543 family)
MSGTLTKPSFVDGELEVLTLKVYYDLDTAKVTYDLGDSTPDPNEDYSEVTVPIGDSIKLNEPPTKEGYIFVDWYDGTNDYQPGELVLIEKDTTLVPRWEKVVVPVYYVEHYKQQYDGTYSVEESEMFESTVGETATATPKTYDNYHLNDTDSVLSGEVFEPYEEDGVLKSLTLKIYYDLDEVSISYDIDNATPPEDVTYEKEIVKYGTPITLKDPPTKEGYIFSGWTDGTNEYHHGDLVTLTKDTVMTPIWEEEPSAVSDDEPNYIIEYYKQQPDGTYILEKTDKKEGTIGDLVSIEPEAVEKYHVNTDSSILNGTVPEPTDENGNKQTLTLKVYYDMDTAVIKYDLNGGTGADGVDYSDETVTSGTSTTVKTAPTRSGYTFAGWNDGTTTYQPDTVLDVFSDILFTAQWQSKSGSSGGGGGRSTYYTISYESNGGTKYDDERQLYGKLVTIDKEPTRDGYKFTGWYSDADLTDKITSVTVKGNTTLYAGWEEITAEDTTSTATPKPEFYVPSKLNGDDHFAYVFGYPDDTVHPFADITRAEVATIFFRLLKSDVRDANTTDENSFKDVNGDWYTTAVSTMEKLGILDGRDDDMFEPDAPITRAEFAAVCARFDDEAKVGDLTFTDISGHWAENEIKAAANRGWVKGYDDNSFLPNKNITRAEAMTLINRVLERQPETVEDLISDEMVTWPDNAYTNAWYYLDVQEATNEHDFDRKDDSIHETWTKIKDRSLLGL